MRTKITIELEIEAPDWTGFVGDTRILLENIIYRLHELEIRGDHYGWHEAGKEINGQAYITPTDDSKGTYSIAPVLIDAPVEEQPKWHVSFVQRKTLSVEGYRVVQNKIGKWSAINPDGLSIIRGWTDTAQEAWWVCLCHYEDNVKGLAE